MSKIKVCSLFSGIGGFETGIFNAIGRENVEVVFASEIDKYATKAYEIIYGFKPHGDITKISAEHIPDHDVLVGGFPCQAFSVAGKRLGFEDTRGTLFFEIVRIASKKKPKALILENVKGLVNHNKGSTLETILLTLSDIGYAVDFQVLNSKYFDVPQNRERIIIVALRDIEAEEWVISGNDIVAKAKKKLKNVDGIKTFNFKFPEQNKVNKIIKDILEENVDEKYYISEEKTKKLIEKLNEENQKKFNQVSDSRIIQLNGDRDKPGLSISNDCAYTIPANPMSDRGQLLQIGYIDKNAQGNRVYDTNGISATIASQTGGLGGSGGGVYLIDDQGRSNKKLQPLDICPTLRAECHGNEPKVVNETELYVSHHKNMHIKGKICKNVIGITRVNNFNSSGDSKNDNEPKIVVEYDRKNGIGKQLDIAFTINSSDWRGLNRNQKQNAVLEKDVIGCSFRTRNYKGQEQQLEVRKDDISNTVTSVPKDSMLLETKKYRIRKLTPLECFRLQGFPDEYYYKLVEAGISSSQLYKMAGNAVTTNKIEAVFKNLIPYIT